MRDHTTLATAAVLPAFVLALGFTGTARAVTVTINPAATHQTIEAFGTMMKSDIGPGDSIDVGVASYRDLLCNDLGLNIIRFWVPMTMEQSNDNADPNVLNAAGMNYNDPFLRFAIYIINQLKTYPDMKFIAAVLSPPAWMKDNNNIANGKLLSTMREELAEYLVAYYRRIEAMTGVRLYGISLQNESAFDEWYGSCNYTATEYRDAFKVLGARFAAEGIDIKLHGADDMLGSVVRNPYFGTINADAVAKGYIDALSVHGYTNGIDPLPTSTAAADWTRFGNMARSMGKAAWMTEGSGWAQTELIAPALHIGMALRYADLSMWVYLAPNICSEYALMCNRAHTMVSAGHKHYYHWVRPGAVRIDATHTDSALLVTAFHHPTNHTLSVVMVNTGTATKTVDLTGTGTPTTIRKFSSLAPSRMCRDDGDVSTTGVSIEANGVVTLYAESYNPPVGVAPRAATVRTATARAAGEQRWLLDGRRAGDATRQFTPAGVTVVRDARGALRLTGIVAGR